jgi:squalene cyclase
VSLGVAPGMDGDAGWAAAADRAASRLVARQNADGSWQGEVVWCPVITAQVVLAYAIMGRAMPAERGRRILRYFASTRRPDGGWGLHPESQSYLFVTTLVYVAARLLGEAPDSPLLRDPVRWLARHKEGLGALPTWGRFWLSLLGLYDRDRMTVCPPELFLLPAWAPLAADRLYCHSRYIYLGMAYLSGVGLHADLGAIGVALRRELAGFTRPGPLSRHRIAATDLYVPPGRTLRLAYDVMATLGPVWRRLPGAGALRHRALDRCLRRIRAEQRASNFQALSPVNGILNALALWVDEPDAPDVATSIAGLEAWCWEDHAQGVRYAGARSTTWDTAFALQALTESPHVPDERVAAARSGYTTLASLQVSLAARAPVGDDSKVLTRRTREDHGGSRSFGTEEARSHQRTNLRGSPWPSHVLRVKNLLAANRRFSRKSTSDSTPIELDEGRQDPAGGWCFGEPTHRWPVSDCTAEALSALMLCHRVPGLVPPGTRIAPARLAEAFRFLLARQNPDGGFATYERRRGGKRLERLNPSEMFGQCMTERSYIECTSSAIRALRHVPELPPGAMTACEQTECAHAVARATDFLLAQQRPDGAWPGFWGINFIYATGFAVAALRDTGLPSEHPAVQRAVDWLHSVQQPDGGWGEHFSGCLTGNYVPNAGSLVIMTSWAVLALLRATNSVTPVIRRGLDWLVSRQLPDGDWPRDSVNGVFFGTAMLDYRLYNTYFPTWALNRARAVDELRYESKDGFPH